MSNTTKAYLSLIGCVAVGAIIEGILHLDSNSVTFGFIVGTISSITYSYFKS